MRVPFLISAQVLLIAQVATAFVWSSDDYYFTSLPGLGTDTCCGSELVGDPNIGTDSPDCLCDLTAGQCDTGCCCDLDCSFEAIKPNGFFGCTTNDTVAQPRAYTLCSDQIVSANIPTSVQESGLVNSFGGADGLLCVVADNSPARGAFFRDPVATESLSPAQVSDILDTSLPIQYGTWTEAPTVKSPKTYYELGEPVLGDGCANATSSDGCARRAPVLLPALSLEGGCSGQQTLAFLRGVPSFKCNLGASGSSLEEVCTTLLDASFLKRAAFASAPSPSASDADLDFFVSFRNTSSLSDSQASDFESSGTPPAATYSAGTCYNALVLYQLQLIVGSKGTLEKVRAYVQVATLTDSTWEQTTFTAGAAYEYEDDDDVDVRPTSGRPGYQRGLPLLVADGDDNSLRVGGLTVLPRTSTGACASGSLGAAPVLFGESMARTCTTKLTHDAFSSFCKARLHASEQPLIQALNLTDGTKIGVYGDAHPGKEEDWVPLTVRYPNNNPDDLRTSWDDNEMSCSNVLSGVNIRVLVTKIGAVHSPISKVVGAELIFTTRTLAASRCALGRNCDTMVSVTATTTFLDVEAESFEFIPENPEIIPPLPYDFFYPFYVG